MILAAGAALGAESRAEVSPALLDSATRLAMLGERIARLNAQLGRDVLAARARRASAEAAGEFERTLRDVTASAPNAEIRDNYLLLGHLWKEYRPAAAHAPTPHAARSLAERCEEVVWIATKGARLLHEQSRTRRAELVVAAGAVRTSVQRLAKIQLLRGWAFPANALAAEAKAAEADVHRGLAELAAAPETGEALLLELRVAENQLAFLRHALERLASGVERSRQLEHIVKTADNIGEVMDRAARAYATPVTISKPPD